MALRQSLRSASIARFQQHYQYSLIFARQFSTGHPNAVTPADFDNRKPEPLNFSQEFTKTGYVSPHFAPTSKPEISKVPADHPDWVKQDTGELLGEPKKGRNGPLKALVNAVKSLPIVSRYVTTPSIAPVHPMEDRPQTFMPEVEKHTKTPMEMIAEVPVTLVDSDTVACWGGPDLTITNGHPIVYIRMNKVDPTQPETCGYCGLRYAKKVD